VQGERELVEGNRSLGRFELVGIPPAKRGVPRIEVSFEIDANGLLNVSAKDAVTGRAQSMEVNPSGGLSEGEISQLMKEAEVNAERDRNRMKLVEARNAADQVIYDAERVLETAKKQLEEESYSELEASLASLRMNRDGEDRSKIAKDTSKTSSMVSQISKLIDIMDTTSDEGSDEDEVFVLEDDTED